MARAAPYHHQCSAVWDETPKCRPRARAAWASSPTTSRLGPMRAACVRGHGGRVHGEAVAVLGYGNDVARAGLDEEVDPGGGVEVLGLEERDEVLVPEGGDGAVGGEVVRVGGGFWGCRGCASTTRFRMPERCTRPSGGRCRTLRPETRPGCGRRRASPRWAGRAWQRRFPRGRSRPAARCWRCSPVGAPSWRIGREQVTGGQKGFHRDTIADGAVVW